MKKKAAKKTKKPAAVSKGKSPGTPARVSKGETPGEPAAASKGKIAKRKLAGVSKGNPPGKPARVSKGKAAKSAPSADLHSLVADVRNLIQSARRAAATAVNTLQVVTNFEIGRRIFEHEQRGQERAEYGEELLKTLSAELAAEFGRGFSVTNLKLMRQFFVEYSRIGQSLTDQFGSGQIGQSAPDQSAISRLPAMPTGVAPRPPHHFSLSWTHYVCLLSIKDLNERSFYEIESRESAWTVRELKRQIASSLYERLALSRDQAAVRKLAAEGQVIERPEDVLKEPYVLEFLGLEERAAYSETDLEQAIIDRLEHFLLELGKGFLFESRQHRFTFDENPTIGILLCKRKKDAIVELTLPPDANIHAKEYKLYLPSKELLREKLIEWGRENEGLA